MRDQAEVCEVSLDLGVEDWLRSCVAERRSVLVEQVHELLGDQLGGHQQVLPPVGLHGVVARPGHVVGDGAGGELCLTNVTEISSKMDCLACNRENICSKLLRKIFCMNHETHWPQFYVFPSDIFN